MNNNNTLKLNDNITLEYIDVIKISDINAYRYELLVENGNEIKRRKEKKHFV